MISISSIYTCTLINVSCLEQSHWCIAGEQRRQLEDFGYWYEPDGRNHAQQEKFLSVEVKPQALEKIFSQAAAYPFQVSLDNLLAVDEQFHNSVNGILAVEKSKQQVEKFTAAVDEQVEKYFLNGLPLRAQTFKQALENFYQGCVL